MWSEYVHRVIFQYIRYCDIGKVGNCACWTRTPLHTPPPHPTAGRTGEGKGFAVVYRIEKLKQGGTGFRA